MTRLIVVLLSLAAGLAACTKTKAAGTNPSDMTAAEHRQECAKHKQIADAYRKQEKEKFTHTAHYRREEHEEAAKQHAEAAKEAEAVVAKEQGLPPPEDSGDCP
jgi:hypothetical protein